MENKLSDTVVLRLRAAVESSPSGLLMIDAEGNIVLVNREIERLFGYRREELLGKPVELLVPDRFRDQHPGFRKSFCAAPSVRAMGAGRDLYGRHKDGSEVPVEIGLNPIVTEEGLFILSSIVDISARKGAEQDRRLLEEQLRQSQKMEAVGTLAGGIAHDFNNLLGAIVGYAELARAAVQDRPEAAADIDGILTAAGRGKRLIERIMAFSRRQDRELKPLLAQNTVADAVKLLRATIPPSVDIQIRIDPQTPQIMGDETSIQHVLMNLGTNAAHAMPGGGRIVVSLESIYVRDSLARSHPDLHEGPYALMSVRDTGLGMDRKTLDRIFEPFFTTKRPGAGTGLGLAVVHNIMKEHEGAILVDSVVGQGTMVKCFFPGMMTEAEEHAVSVEEIRMGSGQRILYVEDQPLLAKVGVRRLESLGYSVTAFTDSSEALRHIQLVAAPYDVVLTDYWMPGMTGLDLAREIHRISPAVPIILLTGFLEELPPETLHSCGIRRVVNKPATRYELASAMREALESKQAGRGA
jgi:PAS domain S-box-containing protein